MWKHAVRYWSKDLKFGIHESIPNIKDTFKTQNRHEKIKTCSQQRSCMCQLNTTNTCYFDQAYNQRIKTDAKNYDDGYLH